MLHSKNKSFHIASTLPLKRNPKYAIYKDFRFGQPISGSSIISSLQSKIESQALKHIHNIEILLQ